MHPWPEAFPSHWAEGVHPRGQEEARRRGQHQVERVGNHRRLAVTAEGCRQQEGRQAADPQAEPRPTALAAAQEVHPLRREKAS